MIDPQLIHLLAALNAITKDKGCDALHKLVDTDRLKLDLEGWVERTSVSDE